MGKTTWQIEEEQKRVAQREFTYWRKVAIANGDVAMNGDLLGGAVERAKRKQTVTLAGFSFQFEIVSIPRRTSGEWKGDPAASHYQVNITCDGDPKGYTCEYSQGSGIEGWPRARRVLESLILDATSGIDDFEDFCSNTGFDPDSRQAKRTHEACTKVTRWFNQHGVSDNDLYAIQQELEGE